MFFFIIINLLLISYFSFQIGKRIGIHNEKMRSLTIFRSINREKGREVEVKRLNGNISESELDRVNGFIDAMELILEHLEKGDEKD